MYIYLYIYIWLHLFNMYISIMLCQELPTSFGQRSVNIWSSRIHERVRFLKKDHRDGKRRVAAWRQNEHIQKPAEKRVLWKLQVFILWLWCCIFIIYIYYIYITITFLKPFSSCMLCVFRCQRWQMCFESASKGFASDDWSACSEFGWSSSPMCKIYWPLLLRGIIRSVGLLHACHVIGTYWYKIGIYDCTQVSTPWSVQVHRYANSMYMFI